MVKPLDGLYVKTRSHAWLKMKDQLEVDLIVESLFEGEGKLVLKHEEHKLTAGDVVLIEAGEKYFWEGNMKIFMS